MNPFRNIVLKKQAAEKTLHGVGRTIRKNIDTILSSRMEIDNMKNPASKAYQRNAKYEASKKQKAFIDNAKKTGRVR